MSGLSWIAIMCGIFFLGVIVGAMLICMEEDTDRERRKGK